MRATILSGKASSILFDGTFYDTGKELDLSFSDAFRLARIADVKADFESVQYDPVLFQHEKFFNFFGDIDNVSGFGNVSYSLLKYSKQYQVAHAGNAFNVNDVDINTARKRQLNQKGAMIWHDQPRERWLYTPFKKNIAIIPWETTVVPRSWIGKINGFDALLVPSKQNIQAFKDSGVKIPIELIHWGIEPTQFKPIHRPERKIFTFGHMGALSVRKGTDILIDAFRTAFPTEKDVQLICKTSYTHYPFMVKDDRIKVQMMPMPIDELMRDFFKPVDCFVLPTRGEGFGLPALEAMATGIPTIATNWGGIAEFLTNDYGWLLDYTMTPAKNFTETVYKEDCGLWTEPNKDHLVQLLQYAYHHQDEVKQKGVAAAEYVKNNWLWSNKIQMFHQALEKHL